MTFAMLDGKLIDSGGMVVKNVAGLDMAKLLIGSFGTLAAIATVNFKLWPMPIQRRTFVLKFATMQEAIAKRDAILSGALQPAAIDLLNPDGAARISEHGWTLLVEAGGSDSLIERYSRALPDATVLAGEAHEALWLRVREFVPGYLAAHPEGTVVRASATLSGLPALLSETEAAVLARAGSGVCYFCFPSPQAASRWQTNGRRGVIEFAPQAWRAGHPEALWPHTDSGFAIMEKVKKMFDPGLLLNRGRLYGRI
jgi:glycolate oxidase FAD binding subunit